MSRAHTTMFGVFYISELLPSLMYFIVFQTFVTFEHFLRLNVIMINTAYLTHCTRKQELKSSSKKKKKKTRSSKKIVYVQGHSYNAMAFDTTILLQNTEITNTLTLTANQ